MVESERRFFGHPRGLAFIVFTEAWERFSFYGMQALLVLYMAGYLLHPGTVEQVIGFPGFRTAVQGVFGLLSTQALASQIFGLYVGMVYFMPVFGGLIGDRVLGQRRAVMLGAVSMAIGHFLMAFEAAFLFALLALIVGSGLLREIWRRKSANCMQRPTRAATAAFRSITSRSMSAPSSRHWSAARSASSMGGTTDSRPPGLACSSVWVSTSPVAGIYRPISPFAARAIAPTCNREMGE